MIYIYVYVYILLLWYIYILLWYIYIHTYYDIYIYVHIICIILGAKKSFFLWTNHGSVPKSIDFQVISASSLLNFVMASFTQPLRITRRGQHRVEDVGTSESSDSFFVDCCCFFLKYRRICCWCLCFFVSKMDLWFGGSLDLIYMFFGWFSSAKSWVFIMF